MGSDLKTRPPRRQPPSRPIAERFWEKVDRSGGPEACWLWQAGKIHRGYGSFRVRKGVAKLAHRVAYELTHGEIPEGLVICHRCDTPSCVNPAHLWADTKSVNMQDCHSKGRRLDMRGAANFNSKLNDHTALQVYKLATAPDAMSFSEIGRLFNISYKQVASIKHGRCWSHITGAVKTAW